MISLDNIDFYHHPPTPKPPAHISSSSGWKSYHVPSAPQSLSFSHPLPPKPPATVTAVPTSTIKGHLQFAAPRNIFDIELENVPTRENSPVERETSLEADYQSRSQAGNDLRDQCQDASPTLVTSSRMSVLPVMPAGTDDCEGDGGGEGGGNQLVTQRRALQDQLDTWPQSRGDAVCSGPIVTTAEADSGYSGGRSVSAVDNLPGDSGCLQLSLSGCEAEKQTTIDGVPKHQSSQLPSPALSNHASPENKGRARPGQHHGIMFEDLPSEASCCGEQTRALTVSASNSPTATPSIASSRDASTDCEDNNISVLPSLNLQPQCKGRQLRSNLPLRRVLRSRVNTESNRRDRPPSVAVVIPVRRSASSMAETSRDSLMQPSHRFHQASASCDSKEDQPTDSFTGNHSRLTRKAAAEGGERPQKRHRRNITSKTAQNTSVSARCHSKDSIATLGAPSGVDFLTGPGEAQEIFSRGIIRIQPHGPRHAYFLTFLPDVVDRPLSHSPPGLSPVPPSCTERATYISSKASAPEGRNVRLARRRAQTREASPKARNIRGTHQVNSRKGTPWSPEEEELLVKLKRDQGLRTPHNGSSLAAMGKVLANIVSAFSPIRTPRALIGTLQKDSEVLLEITEDFLKRRRKVQLVSFYELEFTSIGPFLRRLIVDQRSAILNVPHEIAVPQFADHRNIARFRSSQDRSFRPVVSRLKDFAQTIRSGYLGETRSFTDQNNESSIPFDLRTQPCSFFRGRDDVFGKLKTYFHEDQKQAQGGAGKTQTALHYAVQNLSKYPSGIAFINATSVISLSADFDRLHDLLRLGDSKDKISAVKGWLSRPENNKWLLVFDNADDLDNVPLHKFYPAVNWGHIIITSRDQAVIGSIAENGHVLSPLTENDAVQLLLEKSGIQNPTEGDIEDARTVTGLLRNGEFGRKLLPHLSRTLSEYDAMSLEHGDLASFRHELASTLLAASRFSNARWKVEAIDRTKKLLEGDND
ncbi:hypothetical protein KXV68_006358 [Aspergillus fumigatus]|nr:hypothetical protein KXV68_006358 [Aspergillus fumigatus]